MQYKILILALFAVKETYAAGRPSNLKDPRTLFFRWAVPYGGEGGQPRQSVKKCGVDLAPNAIRKCYFTDCFKSLHVFPSKRRRAAGDQIHATVRDGKSGTYKSCGNQAGKRRLAGGVDPLAIQCRTDMCDTKPNTKQFRYWVAGADSYKDLPDTLYNCPLGTGNSKFPVFPEHSWQWYTTNQGAGKYQSQGKKVGNCIYETMPANCDCKTLVCKVSTEKEKKLGDAPWDTNKAGKEQSSPECNFIVRIEDVWPSPMVSKKMMWWMFTIAGVLALGITAYYIQQYGTELEKGHEEEHGN